MFIGTISHCSYSSHFFFIIIIIIFLKMNEKWNINCHMIFVRILCSYFHHIFQSHAEYSDYLNRIFSSHIFCRPFIRLIVAFAFPSPIAESEERKKHQLNNNKTIHAVQWHINIFDAQNRISLLRLFYDSPLKIDECLYFSGNNTLRFRNNSS